MSPLQNESKKSLLPLVRRKITPPPVDIDGKNLILTYQLVMRDVAGPVPPCDAH